MNKQWSDRDLILRVEERLEKRREFYSHLSSYIGVNLMLWAIWFFTGAGPSMWPMWVMFFWGFGVAGHAWDYITKHGFLRDREQRILQEEVAREYERIYGEKLKNDDKLKNDELSQEPIGIGEDGELIYSDDR